MSIPHNEQNLGKPLRSKKKRSAVFIVIVASIAVHLLAGLGLAAVKIIEVLQPEPEFEAPPVVEMKPPPPPPPPPPTTKRSQRSLPRPQPLAVKNAQNTNVPAIEMNDANLTIGGGRGFGGGLGALGGAVADSLRITSFGFDRAMEGTLEGTLFDFKTDRNKQPIRNLPPVTTNPINMALIPYIESNIRSYATRFDIRQLEQKYYRADKNLYASYFVIPFQRAAIAPRSFGAEGQIQPSMLGVHYEGSYKPQKTGTFRLVGRGDDILLVRVNGKLVLDGSVVGNYSNFSYLSTNARKDKENPRAFFGFNSNFYAVTGNWFNLREGVGTKVEIFISEVPGGDFGAYILMEEQGVPGLKLFTTRPLSDQDKAFLTKLHPDVKRFF